MTAVDHVGVGVAVDAADPHGVGQMQVIGWQVRVCMLDCHVIARRPQPRRSHHGRCCRAEWTTKVDDMPICAPSRSEEHTSELQSLMRLSYAVFCLKKKK